MWKKHLAPKTHTDNNLERLARISTEFAQGYALLETITKGVTYFGSSQPKDGDAMYQLARTLAGRLALLGHTTVTGGGPGIMEAANRGAKESGGRSVGFNLILEEEKKNLYVGESVSFYYLFVRKVMLASAGHAYVFFPGGFGTLDEFFEISTLIHTHKMHEDIPVICVGRAYWQPLFDYLMQVPVQEYGSFDPAAMRMWSLVDSVDEAIAVLEKYTLATRLYGRFS